MAAKLPQARERAAQAEAVTPMPKVLLAKLLEPMPKRPQTMPLRVAAAADLRCLAGTSERGLSILRRRRPVSRMLCCRPRSSATA